MTGRGAKPVSALRWHEGLTIGNRCHPRACPGDPRALPFVDMVAFGCVLAADSTINEPRPLYVGRPMDPRNKCGDDANIGLQVDRKGGEVL